MRRTLFCLLILLTAFRGLVGDAMAYGMTQQAMSSTDAIQSVALHAHSMSANGDFSSEKTEAMPCHQTANDADADNHAHACNSCMVCHSPALQLTTAVTSQSQDVKGYAIVQDRAWMSAELSRLQKPPVS